MNGAILGMRKATIKRHLDEIIAFSGVERYIDTPVKRYSSGMYVRLAFAVAAHLDPDILVLDEVLAVGDVEFQKKCLGKMKDVSEKEGRTILFVSHNMQAISTLTQSCITLRNGQLLYIGDTAGAIQNYLSEDLIKDFEYKSSETSDIAKITYVKPITSLPSNTHVNGERMEIQVEIFTPKPISGAGIAIQLTDEYDKPLIHTWIFDSEIVFGRSPGTYVLRCIIPKLRLYMGKYYFNVHFSEIATGKKLETLIKICPIEVVMYGKKRDYDWQKGTCVYLEDTEWQIEKK